MMNGNFHSLSPFVRFKIRSINRALIVITLGLGLISLTRLQPAIAQSSNPSAKPAATASTTQNAAKPLLKPGSQGNAVTELQAILKLLSYYNGPVNGMYDEPTAAAVAKFQKAANLTADGIVGTDTWERLLPPSPAIATTAAKPTAAATPDNADSFPMPGGTKPNPSKSTAPAPKPATSAAGTPAPKSDRPPASESATFPILRLGMKGPAVEGLQERLRALGFLKGSVDGVFGAETQAAVRAAQQNLKLEPDGVVGNATWLGLLR